MVGVEYDGRAISKVPPTERDKALSTELEMVFVSHENTIRNSTDVTNSY